MESFVLSPDKFKKSEIRCEYESHYSHIPTCNQGGPYLVLSCCVGRCMRCIQQNKTKVKRNGIFYVLCKHLITHKLRNNLGETKLCLTRYIFVGPKKELLTRTI
uniref:Uncharacterized protein n=1 Tax=Clastoptera arizonana TaxID=38151 RepID=A0A1B6DTN6_9HEMI